MWGIIPAAGQGTRIQPLAFSKELLPIGSHIDGDTERPRAVSEYLVERMLAAGVDKLCFVISPGKADILGYYSRNPRDASVCYVVQPEPRGLCDALFRALPLIAPEQHVLVGLPDTVWFPEHGLRYLPDGRFSFLLFRVAQPQLFDAVRLDGTGRVSEIQVKHPAPATPWVWGAFKLAGATLAELHALWRGRRCADEYVGTLVNAYIAAGHQVYGVSRGEEYVDVGTVRGYRQAVELLARRRAAATVLTGAEARDGAGRQARRR